MDIVDALALLSGVLGVAVAGTSVAIASNERKEKAEETRLRVKLASIARSKGTLDARDPLPKDTLPAQQGQDEVATTIVRHFSKLTAQKYLENEEIRKAFLAELDLARSILPPE